MQQSSFTASDIRLELYDEDDVFLGDVNIGRSRWMCNILGISRNVDELKVKLANSGKPAKGILYQQGKALGTGTVSCIWAKQGTTVLFPEGSFLYEQVKKAKTE